MPNRLIHETSPYLLQHAHNPVDWYPWGEEAFDRARREDKPILLSVGYSACHWCHVMEHESFENEDIATLMNRHFVSVKVDREERPDIDSIYMAAVQAMTQRGGWPMTVFLTPDGKPFYGGTYYPPEDRMGMPGFPRVLTAIAEAYAGRREEILRSGESIVEHLQRQAAPPAGGEQFDPKLLQETAAALPYYVDRTEGGFGTAPKFPQPMVLDYLLRLYRRTQDPDFLQMAEHTLTKMARGGMYDQLGGGFHRYSTDARWLVPHFEKMLYDNAQLAQVYLHAFQITGRALYRRVAEEILDYVRREMTSSEGAFYSTQDADSEGQEGKFFVWTLDEVQRTLGDAAAEPFVRYYDVTEHGNWEGLNILHVALEPEAVAAQLGMSLAELDISLEHSRQLLLAQREQRIHPGRDDKALTSWNGMMLKAFAEAGAILARPDYTEMARANARFLLGTMLKDGKLLRTYKDGRAKLNGYLEDYANLVDGLLRLYESTFELAWFESARALAASMIERFWSAEERCFYDTSADHETLIKRPRDVFDNATPSGTSVAAEDLLRLYFFTADDSYRSIGEAVLAGLQESATNYPLGFGRLCSAADLFAGPTREVAIIGRPGSPDAANLLHAAWSAYSPNAVLAGADPTDAAALQAIAILQDRPLVGDQAAAYVCEAFVCQAPITNPAGLQTALRA